MKKRLVLGVFFVLLLCSVTSASDLNNVLQGVLGAVSAPKAYIFHPGEKIYSKMGESLYYCGWKYADGKKILLLGYLEAGVVITLQYPEPDVIQFKDLKLKIVDFNNQFLKIQEMY